MSITVEEKTCVAKKPKPRKINRSESESRCAVPLSHQHERPQQGQPSLISAVRRAVLEKVANGMKYCQTENSIRTDIVYVSHTDNSE